MTKRKTILVTGGTGLIGSALRHNVENGFKNSDEEWIFLSSKDGDLRDAGKVHDLFDQYKPTHVIHLAAVFGGLFYTAGKNLDVFRACMKINDNVLAECHRYGVKKVVSCSSSSMFPCNVPYPVTEEMIDRGPPHDSVYGYAYAKRMIEVYNKGYNMQKRSKFTTVIPSNVFGPNDNFNIESGQVVPALIHKVFCAMRDNTDLVLSGTGLQRRQLIYSRDVAKLIIWVLREYDDTGPIILSVDEEDEVSINEVANIVTECMNFKGKIISEPSAVEGLFRKTASNEKLRRQLPYFAFTPLKEAIQETCNWFKEHYEEARK